MHGAIISIKIKNMSSHKASVVHCVLACSIQNGLDAIKQYKDNRVVPLVDSSNSRQLC